MVTTMIHKLKTKILQINTKFRIAARLTYSLYG